MRRIIVLATGMALAGGALAKGPQAVVPNVGWTTHGLDGGETRFSPLTQITPDNVAQMGIVWSADFNARSLRGVEATPLVVNGVMYVSGPWSVVMAMDARTGRVLWRYDPDIEGPMRGAVAAMWSIGAWPMRRARSFWALSMVA
jgi:alcohol dehydrogenase (cytochrome c)/quinohemoprotein ethanol dehydrogenase